MTHASQFKAVTTPSGKKAFEAWCAVWISTIGEVSICAPSIDALKTAWGKIVGIPLDVTRAQHIWIVSAEKDVPPDDAPRIKPGGSDVPCSVAGCTRLASFIIKRKAVCEEHRG